MRGRTSLHKLSQIELRMSFRWDKYVQNYWLNYLNVFFIRIHNYTQKKIHVQELFMKYYLLSLSIIKTDRELPVISHSNKEQDKF